MADIAELLRRPGPGNHTTVLSDGGRELRTLVDLPPLRDHLLFVGVSPSPESIEAGHYQQGTLGRTFWRRLMLATLLPPGTKEVVVAGCEAHVCVLQTVLGLVAAGRRTVVATDAVGSRDPADKAAALERMAGHGAELVTSEMVLFEWLGDARHPRFREVQKLLK